MEEKIQVLGLQLNSITAKDAMKCLMSYIKTEPASVIEMITMNSINKFQNEENVGEIFQTFELVLAGDKGILQAAGIKDEKRLKEADEQIFIKMLMHYLHKNSIKVFLLADTQADLMKLEGYMEEDYARIQIVEMATMDEQGISDDMILNLINGAEAECVISVLPSPLEEKFVCCNKALVNTKVWLGLGNLLDEMKREKTAFRKIKDFITRLILKKQIAKKGENA